MTISEFAKKYGVLRNYVGAAVEMAEPYEEPKPEERKVGAPARQFKERDMVKALVDYYAEKRENYISKARRWTDEANRITARYRERQDGQ